MWKLLNERVQFISNDILGTSASSEYQAASIKLSELSKNLCYMGSNNGSWFSKIRNEINYKHSWGTWFPYTDYQKYYVDLTKSLDDWKKNPMQIELHNLVGKELLRFLLTCQFLISLSREICIDISRRCSEENPFKQ